MKIRVMWWGSLLFLGVYAGANHPAWWVERGVVDTNRSPNDYGPVNQGQLKWTARCASDEFDEHLPGGVGPAIGNLISSFTLTNNFCPVNLGQLKYVARPFYDRLIEEGYTTDYPWTPTTADDRDYAPAVLGQLKNVFGFDVAQDSDGDGLPDWWEVRWFGGVTNWTGANDTDDDDLSNAEEYSWGTNPLDTDSDDDGLGDGWEVNTIKTDPLNPDSDGDLLPDGWEVRYGLNPNSVSGISGAAGDPDGDHLPNIMEFRLSTNPRESDTDHDHLLDGLEVNLYRTNPLIPDTDRDGLSDGLEVITHHTNPLDSDTDDDGFSDSEEINEMQSDPTSPSDGAEMVREMRQRLSANWSLIYSTPLVFTNSPGSAADLNDIRTALLTLSGQFHEAEEE